MSILGASAATRTRRAAGTRDANGRWVEGAGTDLAILAAIQPAPAKDRQNLPSGFRSREVVRIWTTTELRPADQSAGTSGDLVTKDGKVFEVLAVSHWPAVLPHYQAVGVLIEEAL